MTETTPEEKIRSHSEEMRNIKDLVEYEGNARTHSDDQIDQIAESIKNFGFVDRIIIDGDNKIRAGHGSTRAALQLGIEKVPVVVLRGLSEPEMRAYTIAVNKIAQNSGWDNEMLKQEFDYLNEFDFDTHSLGFSDPEMEFICAGGDWESDIDPNKAPSHTDALPSG